MGNVCGHNPVCSVVVKLHEDDVSKTFKDFRKNKNKRISSIARLESSPTSLGLTLIFRIILYVGKQKHLLPRPNKMK